MEDTRYLSTPRARFSSNNLFPSNRFAGFVPELAPRTKNGGSFYIFAETESFLRFKNGTRRRERKSHCVKPLIETSTSVHDSFYVEIQSIWSITKPRVEQKSAHRMKYFCTVPPLKSYLGEKLAYTYQSKKRKNDEPHFRSPSVRYMQRRKKTRRDWFRSS